MIQPNKQDVYILIDRDDCEYPAIIKAKGRVWKSPHPSLTYWDTWSAPGKSFTYMAKILPDVPCNDYSTIKGFSLTNEGAKALRMKYMQELRQESINARDEAQAEIDRIEGVIAELNAIEL